EAREQPRRRLAHVADTEREDEAVERDFASGGDGGKELVRRLWPPALALLEPVGRLGVARLQREDVLRRLNELVVVECLNVLFAQALDSEGVARHEVLEAFAPLRRTDEPAGAAAHHIDLAGFLVGLAHGVAAADRAAFGISKGLGAFRTLVH